MYSTIVVIACSGLFAYFLLPILLASLIFSEHKGLFFKRTLKQRKIFTSIFALVFGLIALCSIIVIFENGLPVHLRIIFILSALTYFLFTWYALKTVWKIRKSQ